MTPEDEPSFDVQLETCLLHGPVDDVVELLHTASEGSFIRSAIWLDQAMRSFDRSDLNDAVFARLKGIERPEVAARCIYEFEQRDRERALQFLTKLEQYDGTSWTGEPADAAWFERLLNFLVRLRESSDGGSDGGAGDREPQRPHDPHDSGAIALEPPDRGMEYLLAVAARDSERE